MSEEGISRLSTDRVQVSTGYYMWKIIKRIFKALVVLVLIVLVVYSAVLVPTALRYVPTREFGVMLVKDPTIRSGGIPAGKTELVTIGGNGNYTTSIPGKYLAAFTYHFGVSKMIIVAGPNGRLLKDDTGVMTMDGRKLNHVNQPVNYSALEKTKWYLTDQYLALCEGGSCKKGEYYVISDSSVLGEIKTNDDDPGINEILRQSTNDSTDAKTNSSVGQAGDAKVSSTSDK